LKEKLIFNKTFTKNDNPFISVLIIAYNMENRILKSIRSIQNQSLKNIEIIIVDDFSTDDSNKYYKYLLETDPRIRIFLHQKNMGVWRTRLDGFLYSKGKYVIHFDTGDLYEDNYVLEDLYKVAEYYNLDSVKMLFRILNNTTDYENYKLPLNYTSKYSKIFTHPYIEKYDRKIFGNYTNIWNRLTKNEIFTKGLYLLNTYILNLYKNLWEDIWWNKIANKVSNNYLVVERYGYIYYKDGSGEGSFKIKSDLQKDNLIHEFIYFIYFNLQITSKRSKKKYIIDRLRFHNETLDQNLNMFKTKFFILNNLLKLLIKDRFVSINDKFFVYKLLKESLKRQKANSNNN
jgi:glycosyltransferase involved in cell wall biosynthesis